MVKPANRVFASLDAEVIQIVIQICHVTTAIVKIRVKIISVDRIHCAKLKTMWQNVNAHLVLKGIHRQNKDVFVYHQHVLQRVDARMVTCALQTFAKYHAQIQLLAPLVKDAIIMFVQRFVTQITIVYRVKFVMNAERVNRDA